MELVAVMHFEEMVKY